MKLQHYTIAILLLFTACKTSSKLPTDKSQPIDLSGSFNATDADIAIGDIYLAFKESKLYKTEIAAKDLASKAYIQNFKVNLDNKNYINKLLKSALDQQLSNDDRMKSLKSPNKSLATYYFQGSLSVYEENKEQNSLTYQLEVSLLNTSNKTVWEKSDYIKKYLKD